MSSLRQHSLVQAVVVLAMAVALGSALIWGIGESTRWTVYILLTPFIFVFLFLSRSNWLKLATLFFCLIVIEGTLISIRHAGPILIGLSLPIFIMTWASLRAQGRQRHPLGIYGALWAFLLLWAVTASFHNPLLIESELNRVQLLYVEGFLYFCLAMLVFENTDDLRRFAWIIFGIGVFCSLLHFYFLNTGNSLLLPEYRGEDITREWRFGGPLGNPNSLANFYGMILPAVILLSLAEQIWWKRALLLSGGGAIITTLFLTGSRGGILAGLTGILLVITFVRIRKSKNFYSLPIALIILFIGYQIGETYFGEYVLRTVERIDQGFEDVRLEIWDVSLNIIADNPMGIGHEPQTYIREIASRRPGFFFASPHNLYLELAVSIGVIGLISFIALVGRVLWEGIVVLTRDTSSENTNVLMIPTLMILVFLLGAFTEPLYSNGHKLNHLFWFLCGATAWGYRHTRDLEQAAKIAPNLPDPHIAGDEDLPSEESKNDP